MTQLSKPQIYRDAIDSMVEVCKEGQGQIGSNRVRAGVWNINATENFIPEQNEINIFLKKLDRKDREVLAGMLEDAVVKGVFEALRILEEKEIEPFKEGYEGSAYNDFIGRLDGWDWPQ